MLPKVRTYLCGLLGVAIASDFFLTRLPEYGGRLYSGKVDAEDKLDRLAAADDRQAVKAALREELRDRINVSPNSFATSNVLSPLTLCL